MGIVDIENAIKELPPEKVNELMDWLVNYHAQIWDKQIAKDLDDGRFDAVLDDIDKEIDSGIAKPM